MTKPIVLALLAILLYSFSLSAQESYNDDKITVTSEILKYEDLTNDKFYNYYNFTVTNVSGEQQKFELVINYQQNGEDRSTQTRDESATLELAPGETIVGDIENKKMLTLFKSFLPGKSGKKASNDKVEIVSIKVNYL